MITVAFMLIFVGKKLVGVSWVWKDIKKQYWIAIFVLLFLAHPGVCSEVLQTFNCVHLGTSYLLSVDLTISCRSREYKSYATASGFFLIYAFGLPFLSFMHVIRHMKRKSDEETLRKSTFNFIISGYKTHALYWEFVCLGRKLLVVIFSVFLGTHAQLLCGLCLIVASMQANTSVMPFRIDPLGKLESFALVVLFITLAAGLGINIVPMRPVTMTGLSVFVLLCNISLMVAFVYFYFFFYVNHRKDTVRNTRMTQLNNKDDSNRGLTGNSNNGGSSHNIGNGDKSGKVELAYEDEPSPFATGGPAAVKL